MTHRHPINVGIGTRAMFYDFNEPGDVISTSEVRFVVPSLSTLHAMALDYRFMTVNGRYDPTQDRAQHCSRCSDGTSLERPTLIVPRAPTDLSINGALPWPIPVTDSAASWRISTATGVTASLEAGIARYREINS